MFDGKKAMELYLAGKTDREIAQTLGKEPGHISTWRRRNKLPSNYKTARKESGTAKESGKGCIGCRYWEDGICVYIMVNHTRRPCPPGNGCTVREERKLWGDDAKKQYVKQLEEERHKIIKTARKKED